MRIMDSYALSEEGQKLLREPLIYEALSAIAASVGVYAEEYLRQFEKVLSENPDAIFSIFEK